ncbi:MAG: hypothetical protein WKF43_00090 [Acidimicrobiales bacterium]
MVPVPEEHVTAVMQQILHIVARAAVEPWDEASLVTLFLETDEPTRSVLSLVARSVLAGKQLTDEEAAARTELVLREVLGIAREVNDVARIGGRPVLITTPTVSETLPNGRIREKRVLGMTSEVAELVRAAERTERAASPRPLEGADG